MNRQLRHVLAEESHPGRAVRLLQVAPGRQRRAAVEDADVVEPEKTALEHVLAEPVLAVDPPGEVQGQFCKGRLEEVEIRLTIERAAQAVEKQGRPGVDGRIHIAEVPFIGRDLAIGMEIVLAEHQLDLLLRKVRIHG